MFRRVQSETPIENMEISKSIYISPSCSVVFRRVPLLKVDIVNPYVLPLATFKFVECVEARKPNVEVKMV